MLAVGDILLMLANLVVFVRYILLKDLELVEEYSIGILSNHCTLYKSILASL